MVRPFPVPSSGAGRDDRRYRCRHAALSDVGRRAKNQDRWFADDQQQLYLVVDGMGGRPAGEVVAETIVRDLPPKILRAIGQRDDLQRPAAMMVAMAEVSALSRQIWQAGQSQPDLAGMGAVLVLAVIRDRQALVIHLGDSRAYIIRAGQCARLTRDHNLLQKLLDAGRLSPEEARGHIASTQVSRYAGMEETAVPDVQLLDLNPGDRLLLCTDGLTGALDHARLAEMAVAPAADLQAACTTLVRGAYTAGSSDNITAVLVEIYQQ
jgi:PPM family protein phosphatase